ncbi:proline racemase family protein [Marinobacter sp. BGYM27]|uniref:proline racemase family protein n=1 Tax=Marinobacter sp. BGYM27 TaxID=2975597 RepID=UPI0021A453BF|nr:proline racemase family protein [Marinobacter sp. BGYM27]MDG5498347.1 proline racemase family protein [Marinobacter sp. BGYM27]
MPSSQQGRMRSIGLVDMQSGGDVSRIITSGVGHLPGGTVLEQMRYIQKHGDGFRRLLLSEPYGDPFMSLDLIVPPDNPKAQAGYIIMEAMGYPLYSGSNTICTATAVLQTGIVPMEEGEQSLILESPAGLAQIKATNRNGRVESITTQGEPAYVAARDQVVEVPHYGKVTFDLVWSGAYFAMVDAGRHGFKLIADEMPALAAFGHALVTAARPMVTHEHPELGEVGPLPFAHLMGPLESVGNEGYRSRSATYVHPGVICRSPTGTGTSARLALMYDGGEIKDGQWIETISPRGSSFIGTVLGEANVAGHRAMHSNITGKAWTLARSEVVVDLDDPLIDSTDLEGVLDKSP